MRTDSTSVHLYVKDTRTVTAAAIYLDDDDFDFSISSHVEQKAVVDGYRGRRDGCFEEDAEEEKERQTKEFCSMP